MRRFTTTVACWAIVFVLPAPAARAAHWPSPNRPDDLRYLDGWRMAAANPRRTGWVPESVPGPLQLEWYKPFEPFISQKVQVIAADGLLFIATARGLYAIDAETGEQKWVYATDMPLGHSPTVVGGVAYVGCFDCRIHAIDAKTGKGIWISEPAGAGFATNPVVEQGKVFAGNRDGIFYALDAATGRTLWTFPTELRLPILYSAAYRDGTLYFAGNDMHAYALEVATGRQLWKSQKLPGACFNSWWPVIYRDRVILTGSSNYRGHGQPHTIGGFLFLEDQAIFRSNEKQSGWGGALAMDADVPWTSDAQRPTLDMSRRSPEGNGPVSEYYESMPWRRTYFVLDRGSGREFTYDFDGDGRPDYAPLAYVGTHSGNRYPPIVGGDGLLYQTASGVRGQDWISRGGIVRWKLDSPFIGVMSIEAHDESQFISGGGNLIQYYHGEYHDGTQGSIDIGTRRMLAFYWYIDKIAPDIVALGQAQSQLHARARRQQSADLVSRPGVPVAMESRDLFLAPGRAAQAGRCRCPRHGAGHGRPDPDAGFAAGDSRRRSGEDASGGTPADGLDEPRAVCELSGAEDDRRFRRLLQPARRDHPGAGPCPAVPAGRHAAPREGIPEG